jgi:hypothetical protein
MFHAKSARLHDSSRRQAPFHLLVGSGILASNVRADYTVQMSQLSARKSKRYTSRIMEIDPFRSLRGYELAASEESWIGTIGRSALPILKFEDLPSFLPIRT